ncbi:MAG: DNA repair protein RecO [Candidatus Saganbacteria bacterium]|nr:DNA repair protein RecO [Candidatus Saganbacteria bacterium]
MPSYNANAINLRSSPFGEADKILTLFSRDYGKIKAIAKGARRPGSKFGGRLEILAYNHYHLASGRGLDIVSQCETIHSFYGVRKDLKKLAPSVYLLKLVGGTTFERQRNSEIFDLLLDSLKLLEGGIPPEVLVKIFEIKLIDAEGFFPALDRCVRCGKMIKIAPKKVNFSHALKGIICSNCRKLIEEGIEIPYSDAALMINIRETPFSELQGLKMDEKEEERLDLLLSPYISDHIGEDVSLWK